MITALEWSKERNRTLQAQLWAARDSKWLDISAKAGARTRHDRERVLDHLFSGEHTTSVYATGAAGPYLTAKFLNYDKDCPLCRLYLEHDGERVLLRSQKAEAS